MKIISLNLHCHKEEKELEKLEKIAKYITLNDIDICLFQEVCQLKDGCRIYNNIASDNNGYILSKLTGYNYYFYDFKIGFDIYEEGLGILSKNEISDLKLINLTHTSNYNDWYRRCAISCNYNGITFINTHLGWSNKDEEIDFQIDNLIKCFKNKTILAGDFNYPDKSREISLIKNHLISTHDEFNIDPLLNPTFHHELDSKLNSSNRMIDFIFHSRDIKALNYNIAFNNEESYVSDHSLIQIEIEG